LFKAHDSRIVTRHARRERIAVSVETTIEGTE
jgi:hypothetical protein